MWMAILEYDSTKAMIGSRLILVDGVTGTEQTGVFTPSTVNTAYVRLSWRSFGLNYGISFVGPVDYTDPEEADGAVWFRTANYSYVEFNA
jgi:hypothetical protein